MHGGEHICHNPLVAEIIIDSHIVLKMSCGVIMLSELSPPRQFVRGGVDYHVDPKQGRIPASGRQTSSSSNYTKGKLRWTPKR